MRIHRNDKPPLNKIVNDPNFDRLTYNKTTWIVARDRKKGKVLLGGLGAMGVGQMWAIREENCYHNDPGFEDAPEQKYSE